VVFGRLSTVPGMRTLIPFFVILSLGAGTAEGVTAPRVQPLPEAHAHNDYLHARPLLDALDHGFCSIEADIYLIDGALLVAHDRKDVRPDRTLEALYLAPLRVRIKGQGGRVYRNGPTITLLVDVKSDGPSTYAALETLLAKYADILTVFENGRETKGAVTVIVSGNRAPAEVDSRPRRYSALDGRATELDSSAPTTLYPWISENWSKLSAWRGEGPMPAADLVSLRSWVERAHARGRKLRFWNTPETAEAWSVLRNAGVDFIGTDNLPRLADFLAKNRIEAGSKL